MAHGHLAHVDDGHEAMLDAERHAVENASVGGFAAEFRELARQRRFVRHDGAPAASTRSDLEPRMSDDAGAMLAELARMSDRLVESREALAATTVRADHAERELAANNERLMAARALVHDAQRAARASAERCAWLEGRCDTLQDALEVAVNASLLTRWRWRRQQRATTS